MLYPTYLSAYRNLLQADIAPLSLTKTLLGDRVTSLIPRAPAVSPPSNAIPPAPTPLKSEGEGSSDANGKKTERMSNTKQGTQGIQGTQGVKAAKTSPTSQNTAFIARKSAKSPITISDQHSRAVIRGVEETASRVASSTEATTTATVTTTAATVQRGGAAGLQRPVNALVGGFGRYVWMLLMERGVQLMLFPLV